MTTQSQTNTIEKIMTLSAGEFAKSMTAFAGGDVVFADGRAHVPVNGSGGHAAAANDRISECVADGDEGVAQIEFIALEPRRIGGGLLELPQARVTITLTGVAPDAAAAFLRRFDMAFQRGGG